MRWLEVLSDAAEIRALREILAFLEAPSGVRAKANGCCVRDPAQTRKTARASRKADYAVVLGLRSGKRGFPAEITDDPLVDPVPAASEPHPNAEEQRPLYAVITRARRQVYLLAGGGAPSAFVQVLVGGGYDVVVFRRPRRRRLLRPLELPPVRTHGARVLEMPDRTAGRVRRSLPLPWPPARNRQPIPRSRARPTRLSLPLGPFGMASTNLTIRGTL